MKTMVEQVATYYYSPEVSFNIFACYDSLESYDNRKVDFYDVYTKAGECINEGDPYLEFPSWDDIYNNYYVKENKV